MMTAPSNQQVARVVSRSAKQQSSLLVRLLVALFRAWRTTDPYRGQSVSASAARSVVLVTQAQRQARAIAAAEMRTIFRMYGYSDKDLPSRVGTSYARTGVNIYDVWNRPAEQFRFAASRESGDVAAIRRIVSDVVDDPAVKAMRNRIVTLAETELQTATRDEFRRQLDDFTGVKYYRRVIHPERSEHGTCGLCVVAADRVYKKSQLLPIHHNCKCTVLPIFGDIMGDGDPGYRLNREDLDRLYDAAGSTFASSLSKIRLKEIQHGELGPIMGKFTDKETHETHWVEIDEYMDSADMWHDVKTIADLRGDMGGTDAEVSAHKDMAQLASTMV